MSVEAGQLHFTSRLEKSGVKISMDDRGHFLDNIFVERLWHSVKYEEVYLHDHRIVPEATAGLGRYFRFYNTERQHGALGHLTPEEVHFGANVVWPTLR